MDSWHQALADLYGTKTGPEKEEPKTDDKKAVCERLCGSVWELTINGHHLACDYYKPKKQNRY